MSKTRNCSQPRNMMRFPSNDASFRPQFVSPLCAPPSSGFARHPCRAGRRQPRSGGDATTLSVAARATTTTTTFNGRLPAAGCRSAERARCSTRILFRRRHRRYFRREFRPFNFFQNLFCYCAFPRRHLFRECLCVCAYQLVCKPSQVFAM